MNGWALALSKDRSSRGIRVLAAVAVCVSITSCAASTIEGTATADPAAVRNSVPLASPTTTPQPQSPPRRPDSNGLVLPGYPVSTDPACPAYRSIEAAVDSRLDSRPSSRALLAEKYGSIADTVGSAITSIPDSDGKTYLRTVADTGARMRSELEQGTATDDSNNQLRLQLVDSWIALSFTC